MDEERLIDHVRASELLYNPAHREYRNNNSRREAWDEIGAKIGVSGNECKEAWNKLRNSYSSARRRRQHSSHQSSKIMPNWKYEEEMAFLNVYEPRRNGHDTSLRYPDNEDDSEYFINDIIENSAVLKSTDHSDRIESPAPPNIDGLKSDSSLPTNLSNSLISRPRLGKRPIKSPSEMEENSLQVHPNMSEVSWRHAQNANFASDEIEMLFLSLARNVKKLSPEEQVAVKIEISSAVFQAELRDIERKKRMGLNTATYRSHPQEPASHSPVNFSNYPTTDDFPQITIAKGE